MKFTRSDIKGVYLCENKTGGQLAILGNTDLKTVEPLIGKVQLVVDLATQVSEDQVAKLFAAGLPVVYENGEYEAGDVVVNAVKQDEVAYAMLDIERATVAYLAKITKDSWSADEVSEADVVIGTPAAIAKVYSQINAEHVILLGQEGLDEFKQTTGVTEFQEGKSVKLSIKPGQELMGIATKVYIL